MSKLTVVWRDEGDDFYITPIIFEGASIHNIKDMVILAAELEYKSFMNDQEVADAMLWIVEHENYEVIAIFYDHVKTFFS
jgi:hypothetical protein